MVSGFKANITQDLDYRYKMVSLVGPKTISSIITEVTYEITDFDSFSNYSISIHPPHIIYANTDINATQSLTPTSPIFKIKTKDTTTNVMMTIIIGNGTHSINYDYVITRV